MRRTSCSTPDDKATAEQVLAEIKDGGDFAALAKQYSQDPAFGAPTVATWAGRRPRTSPSSRLPPTRSRSVRSPTSSRRPSAGTSSRCIEKREDRQKPLDEVTRSDRADHRSAAQR